MHSAFKVVSNIWMSALLGNTTESVSLVCFSWGFPVHGFFFLIRHIVTFADHSIFCESHNHASECASVYMTTRRRLCSDSVWVNIGVGVCSVLASQLENSWRWSSDWGVRSMCLRFFLWRFLCSQAVSVTLKTKILRITPFPAGF